MEDQGFAVFMLAPSKGNSGVWELWDSPAYISSEDALYESDLDHPTPGRAKLLLGQGKTVMVNVLYERNGAPYIRAPDLDEAFSGP